METIVIGSENPVKVVAVRKGFEFFFEGDAFKHIAYAAPSGVSDQPKSQEETMRGSINRALASLRFDSGARYGVGLEGGIYTVDGVVFDGAFICVAKRVDDGKAVLGIGQTIHVHTSAKIMAYLEKGEELGTALDELLDRTNMKHQEGHLGVMTNNIVTREVGYVSGVLSALGRFKVPFLYEEDELLVTIGE